MLKLYLPIISVIILSGCATKISGVVLSQTGSQLKIDEGKINIIDLRSSQSSNYSKIIDVDEDGFFSTSNHVPNGTYLVETLIPGFELSNQKITVNQDTYVTFKIKKSNEIHPSTLKAKIEIIPLKGGGNASITPPNM
ncbi:MAG: hypothetical protein CMP10_06515 [Zetaproteobacteria bacterium]|nr:hypothetical protein [Pseudobdellovibrionaceae bacterium]|tara:strand:- start:1720 stop:2133 length:414 start_codon:yes stop_codon:yes gene_type:complete